MKYNKLLLALATAVALLTAACTTDASDDWDATKVCPDTGTNIYGEPNRGTFTDERDGQVYKYTTIGDQVWMAENLRYEAPYSVCFDDLEENCTKYGRLYSAYENGEKKGIVDINAISLLCPNGWHVPSEDDFTHLFEKMGGNKEKRTATRLRSVNGWKQSDTENGTDDCGFSAYPFGVFCAEGYEALNVEAIFLTSTARYETLIVSGHLSFNVFIGTNICSKESVRCIKD
ncbi:MAG: hypothetical protein HUK20_05325 [Fibrobacter sp.]|nr:hypothetical protein [Fibrobacter sp.]